MVAVIAGQRLLAMTGLMITDQRELHAELHAERGHPRRLSLALAAKGLQ